MNRIEISEQVSKDVLNNFKYQLQIIEANPSYIKAMIKAKLALELACFNIDQGVFTDFTDYLNSESEKIYLNLKEKSQDLLNEISSI